MKPIIENLPFTLNGTASGVARIGLVVLASDYTIEAEFREVFKGNGVEFYTARIANSPSITPATLADMQSRIRSTVELILPGEALDVVAYCCTSASVVLGEEAVFEQLASAAAQAKYTTPVTAAFAAFNAFKAKRIAVLTPYRADVNKLIAEYIEAAGFEIETFASFNEEQDPVVARIDGDSLKSAIERLLAESTTGLDAVFVSCTSVRMLSEIAELESAFGIPITSSNQALAWHCLRLSGSDTVLPQLGSLFEQGLPA